MVSHSKSELKAKLEMVKESKDRRIRRYRRELIKAQEAMEEVKSQMNQANVEKHNLYDQYAVLMHSHAAKIGDYNYLVEKHNNLGEKHKMVVEELKSARKVISVKCAVIDGYRKELLGATQAEARAATVIDLD